MFFFPPPLNNDAYYGYRQLPSYIRMVHASPNASAVDIYVNNAPFVRNLTYGRFSTNKSLVPGVYNVKVFPAGKQTSPLINHNINVTPDSITTFAVIGLVPNLSLYQILEPSFPQTSGRACLRAIHLSPDAPPVDIILPNGQKLFSNVRYMETTNYIHPRPGVYNLRVKLSGSDEIILRIGNVRINPNRCNSIYIIGLAKGKPPIDALISLDGRAYFPR